MKKKHIFLLFGIALILIGLAVSLVFVFLGLYHSSQESSDPVVGSSSPPELVQYVIDSWHFHDAEWDSSSGTLIAIRSYDLCLEDAQKVGAQVFTEDLAPESYLPQATTMKTDIQSRFSLEDIVVVISFRGNQNEELFRIDSEGNISTCWTIDE